MRVLVTGANGHLGCNVVRELLDQGHEPVPFVRSGGDMRGLAELPPSAITGDILDAKLEAEREAWRLADELRVPLVVLCPGGILGRHDYRITPTTLYLLHLAAGTGFSAPGGLNIVDARDAAWAHVAALTLGEPGSRLAIGGQNLSYRALAATSRPTKRSVATPGSTAPAPHECLDFQPRPAIEAVRDALRWLASIGKLSPTTTARIQAQS